ncbi:MAG: thermonuclease family protein [Proteobacteria bacterium]|nr:thermonuclease family protein [Pseudomonadota bacterium]
MPAGEMLAGPVPAAVVRVVDGDTLVVRARIWLGQSVETHVRVDGVDTPELKGRCPRERALAEDARRFVIERLAGGAATLRRLVYDKYGGRVRARVETAAGEDLGGALIAAGLARPYDGGARRDWCTPAEGAELPVAR